MDGPVEIEYTGWIVEELLALPAEQQARIAGRVRLLGARGLAASARLGHVKALEDGIWELRVLGKGPSFRLLFFVAPGRTPRLVVLTSCVRKSEMLRRNVLDAAVARARRRRDLWLRGEEGG